MGNAAQSKEGFGMCLPFPIFGFVKFIDVWTETKMKPCSSVENERI